MAVGLHQLGILAQGQGLRRGGGEAYRRSLEINERIGDQQGIAKGLHNLGALAQDQGRVDDGRGPTAAAWRSRSASETSRASRQVCISWAYWPKTEAAPRRRRACTAAAWRSRSASETSRALRKACISWACWPRSRATQKRRWTCTAAAWNQGADWRPAGHRDKHAPAGHGGPAPGPH